MTYKITFDDGTCTSYPAPDMLVCLELIKGLGWKIENIAKIEIQDEEKAEIDLNDGDLEEDEPEFVELELVKEDEPVENSTIEILEKALEHAKKHKTALIGTCLYFSNVEQKQAQSVLEFAHSSIEDQYYSHAHSKETQEYIDILKQAEKFHAQFF